MLYYNRSHGCGCSCNNGGPEPFSLKMLWGWIKFYFSHKPTNNEKIQNANEKLQEKRQQVMALVDEWPSIKDDIPKSNAAIREHLAIFRDALVLPTDNIHIVQQMRELLEHPETLEFIPLEELEIQPTSTNTSATYHPLPLTAMD